MNGIVNQIVHSIKKEENYSKAAQLMIQNNLTIATLSKQTLKLTQLELAKLADAILQKK